MKNNFNNLFRDLFSEDLFWSNATMHPLFNKLNNNVPTTMDYSQNLPSTNVYEDEWSFRYELATPGFTKKDLTIDLESDILTIWGEKTCKNKKETGEYVSKGENGVTTLYLPKVTPTKTKKENRKIEIV